MICDRDNVKIFDFFRQLLDFFLKFRLNTYTIVREQAIGKRQSAKVLSDFRRWQGNPGIITV